MNRIIITVTEPVNKTGIYKKHQEYKVFLGPNNSIGFANKQEAANYAAMVTKHVNEFIRIANKAYIDLFTYYRTIWPSLNVMESKKFLAVCDDLNYLFNNLFECENHIIFTNCYSIYTKLKQFCEYLEKFLREKKRYVELYLCNAVSALLNSNSVSIQIIKSHFKDVED